MASITYGKDDPGMRSKQARALFSLYYLTGCRVSELVRCKRLRFKRFRKEYYLDDDGLQQHRYILNENGERILDKGSVKHDYEGIRKKNIKIDYVDGKPYLYIRTENRKHKDRRTKRQPIPIEFEQLLVSFIKEYVSLLENDALLFDFGDKRATQIINDTTGFNIHFIRHIRATHLVVKYDFNDQMLVKFMGWTDSRPAKYYVELRTTDLARAFYKNSGGFQ